LPGTPDRIDSKPGPCLIDFSIAAGANVLPMVPPGSANRDAIESSVE
jgi:hypothetical protein